MKKRVSKKGSAILKALIGLIILNIIVFGGWFFYETFLSSEAHDFFAPSYSPDIEASLAEASGDVEQFYKNMRFNHNRISYYINPDCGLDKRSNMQEAFRIISVGISNKVTFYSATEDKADILVGCSVDSYEKEENIFIAGEGGPTKIINSSMPVIIRGKVLLYNESRAICDEPLLEIHELLHVFGYDHIDNDAYVMYPFLDCDQEINPDLLEHMAELYSIEPFAELSFTLDEMAVVKHRHTGKWYTDFNVSIDNTGLINAENSKLKVYANNNLLHTFGKESGIDSIAFGGGERFSAKNIRISSATSSIKFELSTTTKESNIQNNILEFKI